MVAAWISADTGVGPSMASGSQVCRKNCADLPIAPTNSSAHARSISRKSQLRKCQLMFAWLAAAANTGANWIEPLEHTTVKATSKKQKSPARLTMKAMIAEE